MTPLARLCSECDAPLRGYSPHAKTCSDKCRMARSRRLAGENEAATRDPRDPAAQALEDSVRDEMTDIARTEIREAVRPVVRAAITEDTLVAIQDLVKLTPAAVAALAGDLGSDDAGLRHRAAALVMKYTVGHPAIVKADDAERAPVQINVNTPRPEAVESLDVEEVLTEGGAYGRTCDMCSLTKAPEAFVDDSDRCRECWEQQQASVRERFADE